MYKGLDRLQERFDSDVLLLSSRPFERLLQPWMVARNVFDVRPRIFDAMSHVVRAVAPYVRCKS